MPPNAEESCEYRFPDLNRFSITSPDEAKLDPICVGAEVTLRKLVLGREKLPSILHIKLLTRMTMQIRPGQMHISAVL